MKTTNLLSSLFGILFLLLLCASLVLTAFMRNTPPATAEHFAAADLQTECFMEAFCSGDYITAETYLNSNRSIALEQDFSNALSKALWDVYIQNLSYEFHGGCYSDNYGLYRDVTITATDISALMAELQEQSAILLANKALATDTDDDYTQEFITDTLAGAVAEMACNKDFTTTRTLTLQVVYHKGHWMIQPTSQLIDLMQGSMGGA